MTTKKEIKEYYENKIKILKIQLQKEIARVRVNEFSTTHYFCSKNTELQKSLDKKCDVTFNEIFTEIFRKGIELRMMPNFQNNTINIESSNGKRMCVSLDCSFNNNEPVISESLKTFLKK